MDYFIKNTAAARTADGNVSVSWVWPSGYQCVRIVFVHKLGNRDIRKLSPDELNGVSDLCFTDEFQISGGKYIYPVGENDTGLLKFRVYCCDDPAHTDFEKYSDTVHITGITLNIRYKTAAKKSGKTFKKLTFSVTADCAVPAEVLAYRVGGAVYPVTADIPAGASELPPVIVPVSADAVLELAAGHEEEFALSAQ